MGDGTMFEDDMALWAEAVADRGKGLRYCRVSGDGERSCRSWCKEEE